MFLGLLPEIYITWNLKITPSKPLFLGSMLVFGWVKNKSFRWKKISAKHMDLRQWLWEEISLEELTLHERTGSVTFSFFIFGKFYHLRPTTKHVTRCCCSGVDLENFWISRKWLPCRCGNQRHVQQIWAWHISLEQFPTPLKFNSKGPWKMMGLEDDPFASFWGKRPIFKGELLNWSIPSIFNTWDLKKKFINFKSTAQKIVKKNGGEQRISFDHP